MAESKHGLICAYILDGNGGGRSISFEEISAWEPSQGPLWVHMDFTKRNTKKWLIRSAGLDKIIASAMTADETRPRLLVSHDSVFLSLRGVNLNPGQEPEDMVSIRVWLSANKVITTRRRMLLSVNDLRKAIEEGRGPKTTGEFFSKLNNRLINRMADVIDDVNEQVDTLEEEVLTLESRLLRPQISEIRRQAVLIRRYIYPQREALYQLQSEHVAFFATEDNIQLREANDRMVRYIEDLDTARERASIAQEELASRISEQMDARMYVLSVVAVVFLPLTFVTGLLGINVGGIPGADHDWGFAVVCGLMLLLLVATLFLLRRKHWM